MTTIKQVTDRVENHRCYQHPLFQHWATLNPEPKTVGALFHQIQMFCSSTRPGHNLPTALTELGMDKESHLLQEIVESEEDHGPELATMAGYIVNRAANADLCSDVNNQAAVEAKLKQFSDELLGSLPGYDPATGLTAQAREAIAVFARREETDRNSTLRSLGTTLALEIISNRHLIPGEKHCLVDSGNYNATFDAPEMHYLLEHYGETGAEHQHEANAMEAVESILTPESEALILEGVDDFLNSLVALWDVLDASLLQSGYSGEGSGKPVPARTATTV